MEANVPPWQQGGFKITRFGDDGDEDVSMGNTGVPEEDMASQRAKTRIDYVTSTIHALPCMLTIVISESCALLARLFLGC